AGGGSAAGRTGSGGNTATGGVTSDDAGIGSSDAGISGADAGSVHCVGPNASFPTFDKTCTTVADCTLVGHTTSCCGSGIIMAINKGETARFQAAEAVCDRQYPACGCAAQGVSAEDGSLVPFGSENLIVASCDNMVCRSHYSGKTYACGTMTCIG